MFSKKLCLLLFLASFAFLPLLGAEVWQTKPYTEWNAKDANKLLAKSPWVYLFQWGETNAMKKITDSAEDEEMSSEREWSVMVYVRLFTARPVRQSYVVLRCNGDKAKLEKFNDFATRDIDDEIVISWTLDSKPKGVSAFRDMDAAIRALSLADLKQDTFLATDTGKRVYIKEYHAPTPDGTGAKFIFPRTMEDGKPFITPDVKTIRFQTKKFELKTTTTSVDATFKVKDLGFGDKIEF